MTNNVIRATRKVYMAIAHQNPNQITLLAHLMIMSEDQMTQIILQVKIYGWQLYEEGSR